MKLEPIILKALLNAVDKEHPDRFEGRIYSIGTKDSILRAKITGFKDKVIGFDGQMFAIIDLSELLKNSYDKDALITDVSDMLKGFFNRL